MKQSIYSSEPHLRSQKLLQQTKTIRKITCFLPLTNYIRGAPSPKLRAQMYFKTARSDKRKYFFVRRLGLPLYAHYCPQTYYNHEANLAITET